MCFNRIVDDALNALGGQQLRVPSLGHTMARLRRHAAAWCSEADQGLCLSVRASSSGSGRLWNLSLQGGDLALILILHLTKFVGLCVLHFLENSLQLFDLSMQRLLLQLRLNSFLEDLRFAQLSGVVF